MNIVLPYKPNKWQKYMMLNRRRFNVNVCHRRMGKTVFEINQLIVEGLQSKVGNWRGAYVAPYLSQARNVAWDYLKFYTKDLPDNKISEGRLSIELFNKSRIQLYGANNPESLRGLFFDRMVMDEVADMEPDFHDSIVMPTLSFPDESRKGGIDYIGTPKGINLLYNVYDHARSGKDNNYGCNFLPVTVTKLIPDEELAVQRAMMSESKYRREFLCDFNASSEEILITLDLIVKSRGKHIVEDAYRSATRIMGVDVGRDSDPTVIMKRQGVVAFAPIKMFFPDNMVAAAAVARQIDEWKPEAVFIDQGAGVGVIDRLKQLGYSRVVVEVPFGSSPDDAIHYYNKRAEMYGRVKDWLLSGGALPDDQELCADLTTTILEEDPAGRIKLTAKKNIRQILERSPDKGDALALTFAHKVVPKEQRAINHRRKREYDVFSRFRTVRV